MSSTPALALDGRPTARDAHADGAVALSGIATILLFVLLNPFLALFVLALAGLFWRIPTAPLTLSATLSFTLFFYFRQYGVDWYAGGATDDVPQYIALYQSDYGLGVLDLFTRFIAFPNGHEPLWHLPLWVLINGFEATPETFVFLHYLVIFLALFLAIGAISKRHLPALALVYFFLIPISIDSISHIWRQQLAFSMFVGGAASYLIRGRAGGKFLIYSIPLVHVASIFFVVVFGIFEFLNRRKVFDSKPAACLALLPVLFLIPVTSQILITVLDSIGLGRAMSYFVGSNNASSTRILMLMVGYAIPQIAAFFVLKNDALNNLFMILCFAVFSIVLALPAANGIYDRLLMFSLPMLALYLFRCLLANFAPSWRIPTVIAVFLVGAFRLNGPTADGFGPGSYLAFGHAFDPSMGAFKMLATL